jgi:hypothetical protein
VIIDRVFIVEQLETLTVRKKINSDNIAICCPWHRESEPSCFVSIKEGGKVDIGTFHCFGCLTADTEIIVRKTLQKNSRVQKSSLYNLYHTYKSHSQKKFEVPCNGTWKEAFPIRIPYTRAWFEIRLQNGTKLKVTDNHVHATNSGDKTTLNLSVGDLLLTNSLPNPTSSKRGTYNLGRFIGLYLAEGSDLKRKGGSKQFQFAFGAQEKELHKFVLGFVEDFGGKCQGRIAGINESWYQIWCRSKALKDIIREFISGKNAKTKRLRNTCLDTSEEFRKGLLHGWVEGDGRIRNGIDRNAGSASKRLVEDMQEIAVSLGIPTKISKSRRTNTNLHLLKYGVPKKNSFSWTLLFCSSTIKPSLEKAIKRGRNPRAYYYDKNEKRYTSIVSIQKLPLRTKYAYCLTVPEGHLFQLPNGIITHNCGISGSWNTLAERVGLKQLPKNGNEDSKLIANHIKNKVKKAPAIQEETSNIALFSGWKGPWVRKYTTFNYEFLKQFSPMRFYDKANDMHRIVFDVTVFGERIGHVIEGNGDGYHHFSKGEWISKALFPFDRLSGKAVVLVEGIADALNLIRHKIPALGFFGVENWNSYKANLLAAKGIEIVCTVCDGDEQGYKCNRKIAGDLEDKFDVRILDLPKRKPKVDPEVVPSHILRVIKNMCTP